MNLQDILSDGKTFTDDMEMQLGEHKVKLGDLRGLTAKQQKELSQKLEAASQRETEAVTNSTKAAELLSKLQKLEEETIAARGKQPTGDDADDFDTNNWWTPVRKRLTAQEKQVSDAVKAVNDLKGAFEKAAVMFATDRWNGQFERVSPKLKKVKEYADWDLSKVRDYATKHQLVDEFGFPSIERAVADLTKATDLEEAVKKAREEGLKEGQMRARLQGQPRPSSAGGKKPGISPVAEHGLEGLGDSVGDDPELMELLETARQAWEPPVQ
jgi:hypothetical protein